MRVKQVLNNSVVLGMDDAGVEVILLGPGIGFRSKAGDRIDPAAAQRTFVPEGIGSIERLAAMVEEISIDAVAAAEEVMRAGRDRLGNHVTARILIPLADHLGFALRRAHEGLAIEYPLRSELSYLYPAELQFGHEALDIIERRTGTRLPAVEAVPIAMHFVNAQFGSEDMRDYARMTDALQRILRIVEEEYGIPFDEDSVDVARFVTHLRFLIVRNRQRQQTPVPTSVAGDADVLLETVRISRPRQYASAQRIAALLEAIYSWPVDGDELLYLSLHVARLTAAHGATGESPGRR
ncbi:MAG: hypothetical protein BGO37_01535 [Cellulomonas sp. 73-92]|mgnify:CR=1 FL=1|nr:MAG: hypothetical protein BGO37_01535 [Cellulomonas sp. 73-92]